jgi:hypothetical protein
VSSLQRGAVAGVVLVVVGAADRTNAGAGKGELDQIAYMGETGVHQDGTNQESVDFKA